MKYQIRILVSIFADKNIWQCGRKSIVHIKGKYPVIFLTFKDVKFDTWDATIDKIRGLLQRKSMERHQELLNSDKLSQYEKEYFTKIISATANGSGAYFFARRTI